MSSSVKMNKTSRPPPPVPPRPSKSLIKEALAKTRQAYGTNNNNNNYVVSGPKTRTSEILAPPRQFETKRLILDNNSRPVIYQSANCKTRSICSDITNKKCENNNNLRESDNGDFKNEMLVTKDELDQIESDKGEIINVSNETENHSTDLWERGFDRNNDIINIEKSNSSQTDEILSSSSNDSVNNCYTDNNNQQEKACNGTLNRNHVNALIDEMFASVLEVNLTKNSSSSTESIFTDNNNTTVIIINDEEDPNNNNNKTKKVKFNDLQNHEFLISELQQMKSDEKILKRQRRSPLSRFDDDFDGDRIQKNDWHEVNDGKKVRMSSCNIKIENDDEKFEKMKNLSHSYGLPPLPSSLSGFKFILESNETNDLIKIDNNKEKSLEENNSTDGQIMNLEKQLATLRREMDNLREQDLSLLSKLWFLNESIQDFRQMLQEQDDKVNLCPSPTPSSIEDEDLFALSASTC